MEIAALVLGIVGSLAKAGADAAERAKVDAAAAKQMMLDELAKAAAQIQALPVELAANDAAADAEAAKKP